MTEAPNLVEVVVVEAWDFLLDAIAVDSKVMIFFFQGERDERQRWQASC